MALKYEVREFSSFGKCMCIENDKMELYVTVDVGPRIIKVNLKGKENMMFTNDALDIFHDEKELKDMFGSDRTWYTYGGHRFWVSPEKFPETYYPDSDPVEYTVDANKFTFRAKKQIYTGWKEAYEITVDENEAKAQIKHILTNASDKVQKGAIWGLNVTAKGGKAYIKQATDETGLLSNRNLILWPYDVISDERFYMDNEYFGLFQDENAKVPYKIGTNNTNGIAVCVNNGTAFKVISDYIYGAEYPDYGCSFEMYSCEHFLEVETLSPLYTLNPGESCEHIEKWELYEENSTDIEDLKKYF